MLALCRMSSHLVAAQRTWCSWQRKSGPSRAAARHVGAMGRSWLAKFEFSFAALLPSSRSSLVKAILTR